MKNIFQLFAVSTVVFIGFSMLPENLKNNDWVVVAMIFSIFGLMSELKKNKNSKN